MDKYELIYLISSRLSQEEAEKFAEQTNSIISKIGDIAKAENLKQIRMAYSIKKEKEAFLAKIEFSALPQKIEEIKKIMEKQEKILRFLLLKMVKPRKIKEKIRKKIEPIEINNINRPKQKILKKLEEELKLK